MKTLIVKDGKFDLPKEAIISKEKRRLVIRTPWVSRVDRLNSYGQITTQQWFRNKERGDKPYVPEDCCEIDGVRYKVKVQDASHQEGVTK